MDNLLSDLAQRLAPITEPLHEAFRTAGTKVDEITLTRRPEFQWLRTHHLRAEARCALESSSAELGDWLVTGDVARNGEFWLATTDAGLRVRVLRDGRGGMVPPAGHNSARRRYYTNTSLDMSLPSLDAVGAPDFQNLLVLWNELADNEFVLRAVRPLEPGSYRKKSFRIDVDLPLPQLRSDFEKLRFDVLDEDLDASAAEEEFGSDDL